MLARVGLRRAVRSRGWLRSTGCALRARLRHQLLDGLLQIIDARAHLVNCHQSQFPSVSVSSSASASGGVSERLTPSDDLVGHSLKFGLHLIQHLLHH